VCLPTESSFKEYQIKATSLKLIFTSKITYLKMMYTKQTSRGHLPSIGLNPGAINRHNEGETVNWEVEEEGCFEV
jgi:hypothetical protein